MDDVPAGAGDLACFARIDTWIFDLDNTLYTPESGLFGQIHERMALWIARTLDLDLDAAKALRSSLYQRYGQSLRGLIIEYDIDPHAYLRFVHDIDLSVLGPADPELRALIAALPGRRVIYTNGSRPHAERVLAALDLADQFQDIFDIVASDFVPKPELAPFVMMRERWGIRPQASVFFEDSLRNLVPAAECGMTTVLITPDGQRRPPADFATGDLKDFLRQVVRAIA